MREEIARVLIEANRRDRHAWTQFSFETYQDLAQMRPDVRSWLVELCDRLVGVVTTEIIDAQKAARDPR